LPRLHQNRKADEQYKAQVNQDEQAAAVFSGDIRKPPDVA